MARSPFTLKVVDCIAAIPYGRVSTYGGIARLAGNPRAARQVARILHSLSAPEQLPWHRVVNREGRIALKAGQGAARQQARLQREGVVFDAGGRIDLERFLWRPWEDAGAGGDTDGSPGCFEMLDFLRRAEGLKSTLRTSWMVDGRQESSAEHSWRLALFALVILRRYPDLDARKVLELCIVHDLGEVIHGDIPAPQQTGDKSEQERADMVDLLRPLPTSLRDELLALWEEYENASTPEARLVKALDKLETLAQQAQGYTPQWFDYAFNLGYGTQYTDMDDCIRELRAAVDDETACRLADRQKQTD